MAGLNVTTNVPGSGPNSDLPELTTDIITAYVQFNSVQPEQVTQLITEVHRTLADLATGTAGASAEKQKPAVSVKKSVTPDNLICLECGKTMKMLKRHLESEHDLEPREYRLKWSLPTDYPMVAPRYAEQRSQFAKQIGLGTNRRNRKSPG